MIHRNIINSDLNKCTKSELIRYIKNLLEEINLIATCNQDLQDILECKEKLHKDYVRYARQTNEIQELESLIKRKGNEECQNTIHLTE